MQSPPPLDDFDPAGWQDRRHDLSDLAALRAMYGLTLLLPDRRGNNRIDSLRNIVHDPRVALLFMVPGCKEVLRVNGDARISAAPALLGRFAVDDKPPRSVLVITVRTVFFQCARAVMRSGLWDPARHIDRARLPSAGTILDTLSGSRIDGAAYDAALPQRRCSTLY